MGIGHRQQVCAVFIEDFANSLGVEQFLVNRVVGGAHQQVMDAPSEGLGPEPAVDQEFLEPSGLVCRPGHPGHKVQNVLSGECGETCLGQGTQVGVGLGQCRRAVTEQN